MNQTKSTSKKLLALLLALIMTVSLLPMSVFAAELGTDEPAQGTEAVIDVPADGEDTEDVEPAGGEGDVTLPEEPAEDEADVEDDIATQEGDVAVQAADTAFKYKILHLDCGRKYFTKDWIIALLYEMKDAGYNQLQLAFGNDGLRFLLDNMEFTANGKTYSHDDVVAKVEAGNIEQNTSGDKRWLTQTEMDAIIEVATSLNIQIVPLLNLPGHANAILDIADDAYNATGSNNTLNVVSSSDTARNFGLAVFKKYVDYFAGKGCQFFNFGADEYANDASGTFSFGRLSGTEYIRFVNFINSLAEYIKGKGMTPRAFNDGLYYNEKSASINTNIQCCYWSGGWNGYNVAPATTIFGMGHSMINTNGEYYYVLGKSDKFDSGYSYASNFSNTTFADGKAIDPVGSMFCIWCDYPNAETETEVAQKVRLPLRAMALRMDNQSINGMSTAVVANGFNADGTLNNSTGGETGGDTDPTTKEENITLTVGKPSKEYTQDGNVTENVNTDGYDRTVASYTAVYKQTEGKTKKALGTKQTSFTTTGTSGVISDGTNYMVIDSNGQISSTTDINAATEFTVKKSNNNNRYTIQGNGYYLTVTSTQNWGTGTTYTLKTSTSAVNWRNSNGDLQDNSNDRYLTYSNGWTTAGNANSAVGLYTVTTTTTDPVNATVITFTGKKVGTTSITIGNVTYNITVTAEDLTNVTPLTVEYWITNRHVTANGATSMTLKADDVYKATGIKITDLVPATGVQDGNDVVYFKTVRLLSDNKQTDVAGVDKTREGDAIRFIRYWGGAWAFSADGTTWTAINSTDQIVAYYLQKTNVTTEITTNIVDWGQPYSEWKAGKDNSWFWDGYVENGSKYVFLDFAVVYEDNTQNPNSFPVDNTLFYHFDGCSATNPRVLGSISFTENDEYEIWKVTVTDGTSTDYSKYSTFTPTYDDTTETTVWDTSMGGEPRVDQLTYTANRSGKLVRVYVRAKVTEDSLLVNYFVEGATDPFYRYNISVAKGTYFNADFAYVPATATNGAYLVNNTVKNIKNVTQTVQWDLSMMTEIDAQYRYSDYEFVSATRSEDGKTVNLYYRFNSTRTFVVDFGLPLVLNPADLNTHLGDAGVTISRTVITDKSTFADVSADNNGVITYKLTKMISQSDTFGVQYEGSLSTETGSQDGTTGKYTITIIPASTVYYEDSFAQLTNGAGAAADATWRTDGTTANENQQLQVLGSKEIYGYDEAYENSTTFSMGSAQMVTVTAAMVESWDDDSAWPTATFTFKGTGFDVISLTDNTSGAIFVDVVHKNGHVEKKVVVDNYYGYKQDTNGEWVVDNESSNCLYQIPVIKVNGLPYDEYTVTIKVAYNEYFDHTTKEAYSFWLDAIRVYDPMGKDYKDYTKDGEGYPQYIKLRDELANGDVTAEKNAVFIDGAANATIEQYKNYGPNNEVYLASGQAITFKVPANNFIATVQIGAKMPAGTGCVMSVNDKVVSIEGSATEMYYALSVTSGDSVIITNTGSDILSLTNLKLTFTEKQNTVTLATLSAEDTSNAVAAVRALFAAPAEPDPELVAFVPERFEASWSRSTVKVGQKATLTVKTSEDVDAITVDGVTIDTYRTRTQRTGWGWNAKRVTYREFTYTITAKEAGTLNCSVAALNAENVASEPITAALTVQAAAQRPSWGGWLGNLFGRWF